MRESSLTDDEHIRIPLDVSDLPSHRLFAEDPPDELYHYTTVTGAHSIIATKTLWLTKIQYLNDETELRHAIDLFRRTCETRASKVPKLQANLLQSLAHQMQSFYHTNICVACFCEDGDLLSQWRAYGGSDTSIALGFSGPVLKRLANKGFLNTWKCVYDPQAQQGLINESIDIFLRSYDIAARIVDSANLEKTVNDLIGYFNTTFLRIASIIKDHHFEAEEEWRIIATSQDFTKPDFDIVLSGDRILPTYKLEFEPDGEGRFDFIQSACVGPSRYPGLISDAISMHLTRNNFAYKSVKHSAIPFRRT